jgi:sulfite reductase alpha subunit-like flavoprotein
MVGPGTGIAAFRSFIHHLAGKKTQMHLVFGCRNETTDNYYAKEWETIPNLKVLTAFSRAEDSKVYVQHVIKRNMYLAKLIVEENSVIYVSGRAKLMPNSVEKAFNYILKGLVEDPDEYIKTMKKDRRYQQEVW